MKSTRTSVRRDGNTWMELLVFVVIMIAVIAVLLPCVIHPRSAARRIGSQNHLKNIGLAMHNYYDEYGMLPPAYVTNDDGEPLYSWRVLLLPYLEEKELYDDFDLKKPWWSDHNRALIDRMPSVYESPFARDTPEISGQTPYRAIVDIHTERTVLMTTTGRSFAEVTDGTSNTAMVIDDPTRLVEWTKPEDIDPLELLALTPIGENDMNGILVLKVDGSVKFIGEQNRSELIGLIYCDDQRMGEQ